MKIAVLGGGFTGLTASYYLAKKGHRVTLFEKEKILGGLAAGFKQPNWDWYLERTVHHLFANDYDILNVAKETGFNKIFFKEPVTASLYKKSNDKIQIYPLDTPQDLLNFPLLSFPQKLRAGLVLAFLKFSPFFSLYERQTAAEFLKKNMGDDVWNILWRELFRKKFGKYAENILASFIWARIKKRTKKLGYIEGGFQNFIDYLENQLINLNGEILKETTIKRIEEQNNKFTLTYLNRSEQIGKETFNLVISTLPTPALTKIGERLFPKEYLRKLKKIKYLHALTLILKTEKQILDKTYWLNIAAKEIPIMGIFQQTNFVDKKYYGGKHICYLGWYTEKEDRLWKMEDNKILNLAIKNLKLISNFKFQISNYFVFKAPWAQPIFDKEFLKNKPDFITPVKNFYIANLDMTYPYDRGTNYAVKLGKEVARLAK